MEISVCIQAVFPVWPKEETFLAEIEAKYWEYSRVSFSVQIGKSFYAWSILYSLHFQ